MRRPDRRRPNRPWRRLLSRRETGGIAALEFGLIAPVFLIVLGGTVDLGDEVFTQFRLNAAVAAASNYALINAASMSNGTITTATLASSTASVATASNSGTAANGTVVINNGYTVTVTGGTASTSNTSANTTLYYCPTGTATNFTWGSSVAQGTSCSGGNHAGQYIVITASYAYTPIISGYSFATNGTISSGAVVQTQ